MCLRFGSGTPIDMLEPDVIVVGGGVGELISQFFDQILNGLPRWSINQRCRQIPLKLARYRADSGIAGGAALCRGIKEEPSVSPESRICANSRPRTIYADPTI